jgi:hypothetical protein
VAGPVYNLCRCSSFLIPISSSPRLSFASPDPIDCDPDPVGHRQQHGSLVTSSAIPSLCVRRHLLLSARSVRLATSILRVVAKWRRRLHLRCPRPFLAGCMGVETLQIGKLFDQKSPEMEKLEIWRSMTKQSPTFRSLCRPPSG